MLTFIPSLSELLNASTVKGRSGKIFADLGARSTVNNLIALQNLFVKFKPQSTLEIGLCFGTSALLFTSLHCKFGHTPTHQHLALDPFQTSLWDDTGLVQIDQAGLGEYFEFRSTFSSFELPRLLEQGRSFDLIYVDGSHLFEDVFVDAYYCIRLLSSSGIIVFDDCTNINVLKVIRFLKKNCYDGMSELDLKAYRAMGHHSLVYDIGKVFNRIQLRAFQRKNEVRRPWNCRFRQF